MPGTRRSLSATALGSLIIWSWPVPMSRKRTASRISAAPGSFSRRSSRTVRGCGLAVSPGALPRAQGAASGRSTGKGGGELRCHPGDVVGLDDAVVRGPFVVEVADEPDAVDHLGLGPAGHHRLSGGVGEAHAVPGCRCVEMGEVLDAVGGAGGDGGDDHAAVAVAPRTTSCRTWMMPLTRRSKSRSMSGLSRWDCSARPVEVRAVRPAVCRRGVTSWWHKPPWTRTYVVIALSFRLFAGGGADGWSPSTGTEGSAARGFG